MKMDAKLQISWKEKQLFLKKLCCQWIKAFLNRTFTLPLHPSALCKDCPVPLYIFSLMPQRFILPLSWLGHVTKCVYCSLRKASGLPLRGRQSSDSPWVLYLVRLGLPQAFGEDDLSVVLKNSACSCIWSCYLLNIFYLQSIVVGSGMSVK